MDDETTPTCHACGAKTWYGQPGKGSFLCDECMRGAACSFCKRPRAEVRHLVMGPGVFICDECVRLSAQIIAEESPPEPIPVAHVHTRTRARRWWSRHRRAGNSTA